MYEIYNIHKIAVQLLRWVQLFEAPWKAAHQSSLSFTISQSLLNFISVESEVLSVHLILVHKLPMSIYSVSILSFPACFPPFFLLPSPLDYISHIVKIYSTS